MTSLAGKKGPSQGKRRDERWKEYFGYLIMHQFSELIKYRGDVIWG